MVYKVLADLTVLVHCIWILFILFGVIFVLKRSKIAWVHLGGLFFSLVLNLSGWHCPLTHLENYLNSLHPGPLTYGGSFITHYLEQIVYPGLPEKIVRIGGILFVSLTMIAYLFTGMQILKNRQND